MCIIFLILSMKKIIVEGKVRYVRDKVVYVEGFLDVKGDLGMVKMCKEFVMKGKELV